MVDEDETTLEMYEWIDSIPLSREKKNIARDFCDGLLVAEILKFYFPRYVEIHNYPSASSTKQKLSNWNTLKMKVFKKIKFNITQEEINDIVNSKPKAIGKVLVRLFNLIVKKDIGSGNGASHGKGSGIKQDSITKEGLLNQIREVDQSLEELMTKKEQLEKLIQDTEDENQNMQRKIEEAFAKLEARAASGNS